MVLWSWWGPCGSCSSWSKVPGPTLPRVGLGVFIALLPSLFLDSGPCQVPGRWDQFDFRLRSFGSELQRSLLVLFLRLFLIEVARGDRIRFDRLLGDR